MKPIDAVQRSEIDGDRSIWIQFWTTVKLNAAEDIVGYCGAIWFVAGSSNVCGSFGVFPCLECLQILTSIT